MPRPEDGARRQVLLALGAHLPQPVCPHPSDGPFQCKKAAMGVPVDAALRVMTLMRIQCIFSLVLTAQAKSSL